MTDYAVPLEDNEKREIIRAISKGINGSASGFLRERRWATRNSRPFLMWDMINVRLSDVLTESIKPILTRADRGRWEIVVLYDESKAHLYVVMTSGRLKELKKHVGDRLTPHYLQQLCAVNGGDAPAVTQIDIFGDVIVRPKTVVSQLIADLAIEQCVTICFDHLEGQVTTAIAQVLDAGLEMLHTENWEEFIPPADYTNVIGSEDNQVEESVDNEEVLVRLKTVSENVEKSTDNNDAEDLTEDKDGLLSLKKNPGDASTGDGNKGQLPK